MHLLPNTHGCANFSICPDAYQQNELGQLGQRLSFELYENKELNTQNKS